jgi:hypothetical protein
MSNTSTMLFTTLGLAPLLFNQQLQGPGDIPVDKLVAVQGWGWTNAATACTATVLLTPFSFHELHDCLMLCRQQSRQSVCIILHKQHSMLTSDSKGSKGSVIHSTLEKMKQFQLLQHSMTNTASVFHPSTSST